MQKSTHNEAYGPKRGEPVRPPLPSNARFCPVQVYVLCQSPHSSIANPLGSLNARLPTMPHALCAVQTKETPPNAKFPMHNADDKLSLGWIHSC